MQELVIRKWKRYIILFIGQYRFDNPLYLTNTASIANVFVNKNSNNQITFIKMERERERVEEINRNMCSNYFKIEKFEK